VFRSHPSSYYLTLRGERDFGDAINTSAAQRIGRQHGSSETRAKKYFCPLQVVGEGK